MDGHVSQIHTSTVLLRGGHRWACLAAEAEEALVYLRTPGADPLRMFVLRSPDGQTLTVPMREIVGVVGEDFTPPSTFVPPANTTLPGSPFIVIENFLDQKLAAHVMDFALSHEATFAAASVTNDTADYRRAKVMYDVAAVLPRFLPRIKVLVPSLWPLLGIAPVPVKNIECQLTAHGTGDYFKRHNDNGSAETAGRTLTYVYYFHREPKAFTGGHLRMFDTVVADGFYQCGSRSLDIEPKANSLVAFPSHCHHEVSPVECPSNHFAERRFTLNGWVVRPL